MTRNEAIERADVGTAERLRAAEHAGHGEVILPAHRFEHLSRGRGWCGLRRGRRIRGPFDAFAERVSGGYRVTEPGNWTVGATDGFSRKKSVEWTVTEVTVDGETWLLAT